MNFLVRNQTQQTLVARDVIPARSLWQRLKGLLGQKSLAQESGLWIEPCKSIHTFFMQFPIDAVFVSVDQEVLRVFENLAPFRITPVVPKARAVLELPAGKISESRTCVGDRLLFESNRENS